MSGGGWAGGGAEVLSLAGVVGMVSIWLPPYDDPIRGWDLVPWYAICLSMLALGALLDRRATYGRWPCWLFGGHRYPAELDKGWRVCRRCKTGERIGAAS